MSDALKQWYVQGLQVLVSANEIGKEGADKGTYQSKNKEVANLAASSATMQERHAQVIASLLERSGATSSGQDNPAMKGIYQAIDQMIGSASDEVKDAAALAGSQLAFHYYIAAYGSLASDAKHAGEDEAAEKISAIASEVKAQDEAYTAVAENLANEQAASG